MEWKQPKNTDKYYWTAHVSEKMHYYGLSEQKILGVIRSPKRIETGIAESTVAVMVPVGNIKKGKPKSTWGRPVFGNSSIDIEIEGKSSSSAKATVDTWNQEIWVMYQLRNSGSSGKIQETITKQKGEKEIIKNIKNLDKKKAKKLMKLMPKKLVIISAW